MANLPVNIAKRELKVIEKRLKWDKGLLEAVEVEHSQGPGNILTIEIESEHITEGFTGFGKRGVSAETVAKRTATAVQEYLAFDVPVGRHLADQLLLPMALAGGGKYCTLSPTKHTTTNGEIIKRFINVDTTLTEYDQNQWVIEI